MSDKKLTAKQLVTQLNKIRKSLLERLATISERIDIPELNEPSRGGDPCDVAFTVVESELASRIAAHSIDEVTQIQHALNRLDNDRYYICEHCENAITISRMNTLPYCTLCVQCQQLAEDDKIDYDDIHQKWQKRDKKIIA